MKRIVIKVNKETLEYMKACIKKERGESWSSYLDRFVGHFVKE